MCMCVMVGVAPCSRDPTRPTHRLGWRRNAQRTIAPQTRTHEASPAYDMHDSQRPSQAPCCIIHRCMHPRCTHVHQSTSDYTPSPGSRDAQKTDIFRRSSREKKTPSQLAPVSSSRSSYTNLSELSLPSRRASIWTWARRETLWVSMTPITLSASHSRFSTSESIAGPTLERARLPRLGLSGTVLETRCGEVFSHSPCVADLLSSSSTVSRNRGRGTSGIGECTRCRFPLVGLRTDVSGSADRKAFCLHGSKKSMSSELPSGLAKIASRSDSHSSEWFVQEEVMSSTGTVCSESGIKLAPTDRFISLRSDGDGERSGEFVPTNGSLSSNQ
mmetsp:Transcript_38936/g.97056  ORF Transcript_38936/g.97056 Transcript_38936/m.97056 type:complete len:330 (+) Transcript_38936:113-1102(+)